MSLFSHQIPPPEPWRYWRIAGLRAYGKSYAAARYVEHYRLEHPDAVIVLVYPPHMDRLALEYPGARAEKTRLIEASKVPDLTRGMTIDLLVLEEPHLWGPNSENIKLRLLACLRDPHSKVIAVEFDPFASLDQQIPNLVV